ncbi:MAG: DUF4249 domain-containing protein [Bernardetiaceae bacterium]|nr:DUF4249 domain-containing protein [Bernardetiaceae bacterium]
MKQFHFILLIVGVFLMSFLLYSCEKVIDLELEGTDNPFYVVDAHVVNYKGYSFVKLTQTMDFYAPGSTPRISNAQITVTDDLGNSERFLEKPDSAGYYVPENPDYKGEIGRTYTLRIEVGDEVFDAESTIFRTTDIDSVVVRFVPGNFFRDEGYYLYFFAYEPPETRDFYRWKTYRNDTLIYENVSDILIASDELVGSEIENLELPYRFDMGDHVRLEQYSLTEEAYNYYDQLISSFFNDGGLFSPPPVNPRSNIRGGRVIGIFSTSAMVWREITITEDIVVED